MGPRLRRRWRAGDGDNDGNCALRGQGNGMAQMRRSGSFLESALLASSGSSCRLGSRLILGDGLPMSSGEAELGSAFSLRVKSDIHSLFFFFEMLCDKWLVCFI